ncbi:MAG: transporter [Acidobacteria bacterium]|nr:transporter [Acidobacteriota bacterium]
MGGPLKLIAALVWLAGAAALAQDNYEIQVYGVETVAPGHTMVETHTNFTVQGTKTMVDGVRPTNRSWHETIEITRGFTPWFETAIYIFTSAEPGYGLSGVGDHIRPRFRAPESWHWPVGVSLSQEFGYQRRVYSTNTWTWEIRPIIDRQLGPWYLSFNPTVDKSFKGEDAHRGLEFSPNFKFSYNVTKKVAAGLEYYGALGPIGNFDPMRVEQQQIMPAIDLNLSPNWEFNLGVGVGVTSSTDHLLVKMIVGYRFNR